MAVNSASHGSKEGTVKQAQKKGAQNIINKSVSLANILH
jgi:hypothetical protein